MKLYQITSSVKIAVKEAAKKASFDRLSIPSIPCKIGCSACCQRYVTITIAEALVMVDFLKKNNKWERISKEIEERKDLFVNTNPLSWFKMGVKCPVLNQDKCEAYPVRPVACSVHFVTSDPNACTSTSTKSVQYKSMDFVEVYIEFVKSFDKIINENSSLRNRAPIPIALLIAEKLSLDSNYDLDEIVELIRKDL